jgi:glycosyltransferase involved in cell wall biosynthesis
VHVLMVSLDTTLLTPTIGDSRARHEVYAEQAGTISLVICNRRSGAPLPSYRSPRVTARPIDSLSYLHFLRDARRVSLEFHREQPIDLITSQDPFLTALIGLHLRRRLQVPLIVQVNGSVIENPYFAGERLRHRMLQRLARWTLRRADAVRVLNEGERQACIRRGIPPDRVCVAPIATDVSRFRAPAPADRLASWRTRLNLPPAAPVAIWVGRPDPVKDLPTLLRAFARVHRELPAARLILVGNIEASAITAQIAALDLSNVVRLTGAVSHTDLPALYQVATAYVHSSYYEGLGLVLIEAGAAGLPVVSTATDGARDIVIERETGFLVPIGDAEAMAGRVIEVFSHPERASKMGERARRHVAERFDQQRSAASWTGMWRAVAAGEKPCASR